MRFTEEEAIDMVEDPVFFSLGDGLQPADAD